MAFALLLTILLVGAYLGATFALRRQFERSALAFVSTVFAPIAAFVLCRMFGFAVEAYAAGFAALLATAFYWLSRGGQNARSPGN